MNPHRRVLPALVLVLGAWACGGSAPAPPGPTTGAAVIPAAPSATPQTPPDPATETGPPSPDAQIPTGAGPLAGALTRTTDLLRGAIDAWVEEGDPGTWPPPQDVVLLALHQQRIYRVLGAHPKLTDRVVELLPGRLRGEARANAGAHAALLSLLPEEITSTPRLRTRAPLPADVLLGYYREAERRFGVDWEVLAAVHFVESKFGRVTSSSSAGAQGPMQFIPSTWAAYGMGGDVHDDHDAILGAANYLAASGAPEDYPRALYAYNHASAYVRTVRLYARQVMRDARDFYAYYSWQVFVATPRGSKRLTGPGT